MKLRARDLAAMLVAAAVCALCAVALKIAFREMGSRRTGAERSSPPLMNPQDREPMKPASPESTTTMPAHGGFSLPYPEPPAVETWRAMPAGERLSDVRKRLLPKLHEELTAKKCALGQPVFVRLFKESRELELWMQGDAGEWRLFRTYPIACFSGTLGPKTKEGDLQAPEGFYRVTQKMLNPASNYHLAFNIGYPNAYDVALGRTGSLIMVHGDVRSVGCFAMTDAVIEEIYLVVEAAVSGGGDVAVHCFPFRMTKERMKKSDPAHQPFWEELLPAYEMFEKERRVPEIQVENGSYAIH